ncbi:MAG TPA: VOC family protein [Acidimicrobiales bacterium]|jgi:catechol 2,3-dioxygenase-like lactoylglutathione lyase family enzyme|nr:VOC family protein [Acidimicrobiales bacterium]
MSRVAVVSVPVTDQDRAAAFYSTYLGFGVIEDQAMGPTMRWVQLGCGDEFTTLTLTTWLDTMPAGSISGLVIDVDDADATRAKMVADGIECSELDDQAWGRYFMAKDPDGNGLVIAKTTPRESRPS